MMYLLVLHVVVALPNCALQYVDSMKCIFTLGLGMQGGYSMPRAPSTHIFCWI